MDRGNVLVIGNSGVGKSTLINSVIGENRALTGYGTKGTTEELEIYESKEVPFRIIDTVGFEPSYVKARKAINSVKKWSKDSAKDGNEDNTIDVIWYCVEGTSSKLFPESIKNLTRATKMWKSVPVIVVITKSYSIPEREENINMVKAAFEDEKKYKGRLKEIIPVVASTYTLNDTAYAPPVGIIELIETTDKLMPEGRKAARKDLNNYKLNRVRGLSQSLVGASTLAAVTIGLAPIPVTDAALLGVIEVGLINGLAKLYKIDSEEIDLFSKSIKALVPVSATAKAAVGALKAIPGINLGASIIQAIVAGATVAAIGQGSLYIFERVYTGEKEISDIDWIAKVMNEQFSDEFNEKLASISKSVDDNQDGKNVNIKNIIFSLIMDLFTKNTKESAK